MAWFNPGGDLNDFCSCVDTDDRNVAVSETSLCINSDSFCCRRAHQGDVIPRHLGHRVWQLLEPADIGKAAVKECWIRFNGNFNAFKGLLLKGLRNLCTQRCGNCNLCSGIASIRRNSVVEDLLPGPFKIIRIIAIPGLPYNFVSFSSLAIIDGCQNFYRTGTFMKRQNLRLDNRLFAGISPTVSPGFKEVRLICMPVAEPGCFIIVTAQMNFGLDISQNRFDIKIRWSVVFKISAQDYNGIIISSSCSIHRFSKGSSLIPVIQKRNFQIGYCISCILQGGIHRSYCCMYLFRVLITSRNNGVATLRTQLISQIFHPLMGCKSVTYPGKCFKTADSAREAGSQCKSERRNFGGFQAKSVIRVGSSVRKGIFDTVNSGHVVIRRSDTSSVGKLDRVFNTVIIALRTHEVVINGNHQIGFSVMVERTKPSAEGHVDSLNHI